MDESKLKQLADTFAQELRRSKKLQDHVAEHQRRSQRAQSMLMPDRIPKLTEPELRELLSDTDSLGFFRDKDRHLTKRLADVGVGGLREALQELVTRGERDLTVDDLKFIWGKRNLGVLLASELLAYRFPTRYWTYSPNVTLPAFQELGEDVKAAMPHGQKSDPYLYLALQPHMAKVCQALRDVGLSDADYLVADIFLWWVKQRAAGEIPNVWLFQANPKFYNLVESLADTKVGDQDGWSVTRYRDEMRIGDVAVFWQSGKDAGIYALGELIDEPYERDWEPTRKESEERPYLKTEWWVPLKFTLILGQPITRQTLLAHPVLQNMQVIRSPTGTNFRVAPEEWDAIKALLPPPPDVLTMMHTTLADRGFHFTDWQLATFYTALQTKGFVILSGISGTGKTKLAQHFAEMLPQPAGGGTGTPDDALAITVQPYMLKYGRLIVPQRATRLFEPPPEGQAVEVRVTYGDQSQACRFVHAAYGNGQYLSLLLRGGARTWFSSTFAAGDVVVLQPELDSDENLTGFRFSVEGEQSAPEPNHLFVSVRPDWRDSKSLLGYYNPLTSAYEGTPFLRFLLRAVRSYEKQDGLAWFVILDEMNLAHVEYYFADLLSVLESGRDDDGWTREPLRLNYPEEAEGELPPREIKLPTNLYIVGTVNVDETTQAFSPKVLDRAFTLELTEADFNNYPSVLDAEQAELSEDERRAILEDFSNGGTFARIEKPVIADYVAEHPEVRQRLQGLNDLLRPHELHFGYRVFDEIVSFLAAAEGNKLYDDLGGPEAAFDAAVLMKVLPKFHGSREKLEQALIAVLAWCLDPAAPNPQSITVPQQGGQGVDDMPALAERSYRYPSTAERVRRMLRALYETGFAAFA